MEHITAEDYLSRKGCLYQAGTQIPDSAFLFPFKQSVITKEAGTMNPVKNRKAILTTYQGYVSGNREV